MAQPSSPRISFTFPFRWLNDDKEFLGKNLVRQVTKFVGADGLEDLKTIQVYKIVIDYHAYEPKTFEVTPKEIQKLLKPVLPYGKCLDVEKRYNWHKSRTMLPLMDLKIYC